MARKSQPADWEAALSGIKAGDTAREYAAKRDFCAKQREGVLTPQKSKSKVVRANGKGKAPLTPANGNTQGVDWVEFLGGITHGKTVLEYGANRPIFVQGDTADSVWFLQHGEVKLAVTSQQGKEAIVSVLGDNEFFGDGCLAGQPLRISKASAVTDCTLYRIEKALMVRLLHEQLGISEWFITHLLTRNTRFEEDLVDQLFTPAKSARREFYYCWRILARKAEPKAEPKLSIPVSIRNTLAQMVGTSRSRVSHFMNKFRTLGFIDYAGNGALTVNNGLLTVILSD